MGFFDKMFSGLSKTRKNMQELEELFQDYAPDSEDFYDDLEELLILSDVGAQTAADVIKGMRKLTWERRFRKGWEAREGLIELLSKKLEPADPALKLTTKPSVILMAGVNGVGKTTSIGKLAARLKSEGRAGTDFVRHEEGSDPAAVVFDAISAAKARGIDVVIIDTAGRLHNKQNLMNELSKMRRIISRELPDADVETLMVLDATTGQNGLIQAEQFKDTADLTGIILTKLDGTAKGGIVFAIADKLGLPVKYVGVGEQIDDLIPFDAKTFVEALFK